jgi:hypothetical protein
MICAIDKLGSAFIRHGGCVKDKYRGIHAVRVRLPGISLNHQRLQCSRHPGRHAAYPDRHPEQKTYKQELADSAHRRLESSGWGGYRKSGLKQGGCPLYRASLTDRARVQAAWKSTTLQTVVFDPKISGYNTFTLYRPRTTGYGCHVYFVFSQESL